MRLVERTLIKKSDRYYQIIDNLACQAKNLSNLTNCYIRQEVFSSGNYIGFFDLYLLLKATDAYLNLPTKVSKQIVKRVAKTWKGSLAADRDWLKNPHKYQAEPKIPRYLARKKGRYLVPYPVDAISRPALKEGFIRLSKTEMLIPPTKVGKVKVAREGKGC